MLEHISLGYKTTLSLIISLLVIQCAYGFYEVEVYRLLSYEEDGAVYGSKISSLNFMASHWTGNLLRKMAMLHFTETNDENLSRILKQKTAGILIILPKDMPKKDVESKIWKALSTVFMDKQFHIPIYFCWENDTINKVYNSLALAINANGIDSSIAIKSTENGEGDSYNFIVNTEESKLLKFLSIDDFYGFLEDTPSNKGASSNPLIMIVASYDMFSITPDVKLGLNEYGSGAIALMNIARNLAQFNEKTHNLKYNVLFYLTGSRTFNFEGLNTWLSKPENSKYVNKIEAMIYLESLASSSQLFINLYNTDDNFDNSDLHKTLNSTAKLYHIPHIFRRLQETIFGGKFPVIRITTEGSNAFLTKEQPLANSYFNIIGLQRNILFLTEYLIKTTLNIKKEFTVFDENYIDHEYLKSAIEFFKSNSHFVTSITKESQLSQDLFKAFGDVVKQNSKITYSYSSPKFYSTKPAKLIITKTSSPFMDLYIFVGVVAYLWLLYTIISSTGNKSQISVEKPRDSSKQRSAKKERKNDDQPTIFFKIWMTNNV